MNLFSWSEEKIKRLSIWDFGALKAYLLLIGIVIGAYISSFVKQYVWVIIAVIVILFIWLMYKVFK